MQRYRLGLIGDNISRSQSPRLHRLAGELCGIDVTYDRLIPADLGLEFHAAFDRCRAQGYEGINVTYPYKETVVSRVRIEDAAVAAIAACNTVLFADGEPRGANTDYTGFIDAFRHNFSDATPGKVAMAGAGGVGKAIAFALAKLGAASLTLFDRDSAKAEGLARALSGTGLPVKVTSSVEEAAIDADGNVNCTPLGMAGHGGTAVPARVLPGARWAFDAVYTPIETEFIRDARAAGLDVMSGYELFLYQGVNAFRMFTGFQVDQDELRRLLAQPAGEARRSA